MLLVDLVFFVVNYGCMEDEIVVFLVLVVCVWLGDGKVFLMMLYCWCYSEVVLIWFECCVWLLELVLGLVGDVFGGVWVEGVVLLGLVLVVCIVDMLDYEELVD